MRTSLPILLLLALVALPARPADADAPTRKQLAAAAKAAGSVNGLCPVMGRLVRPDGGSSTYKGERIALCCKGCKPKFEADPTRYMDRLRLDPPKYWYVSKKPSVVAMRKARRASKAANGRCPVMGKVVTPKGGSSTYGKQRIQFCCPPCKVRFEKDPEKYMRMMRADPLAYAYLRPGPTNAQMRAARERAGTANGRCPVMGRLVTPQGGHATHRGEKIGFCCPPCATKFAEDPEKYLRRMRAEPAVYGYVARSK